MKIQTFSLRWNTWLELLRSTKLHVKYFKQMAVSLDKMLLHTLLRIRYTWLNIMVSKDKKRRKKSYKMAYLIQYATLGNVSSHVRSFIISFTSESGLCHLILHDFSSILNACCLTFHTCLHFTACQRYIYETDESDAPMWHRPRLIQMCHQNRVSSGCHIKLSSFTEARVTVKAWFVKDMTALHTVSLDAIAGTALLQ